MFIETIEEDKASPALQELYNKNKETLGYIANYTRLFSHRPEVMVAWVNLLTTVRQHTDMRRYELITLAAAKALKSSYCSLAHGTVLKEKFYTGEEMAAIARDYHKASLSEADVAMMDFAEKVVRDATAITPGDVQTLRDNNFSEVEIFDITAIAAVRCFFSKTLDSLGAAPDQVFHNLDDELKQSLTVGRAFGKAT